MKKYPNNTKGYNKDNRRWVLIFLVSIYLLITAELNSAEATEDIDGILLTLKKVNIVKSSIVITFDSIVVCYFIYCLVQIKNTKKRV